ncbi:DUF5719 family protein [Microbacterium lacusdiani]
MKRITVAQRIAAARVVVGAAVAVGSVIAVTAAAALPWPEVATEPRALEVAPRPAETVLACDGPVLALGRVPEDAAALSVAAPADVTAGDDAGGQPRSDALGQPGVAGEAGALRLVQAPTGREPVSVAAATSATLGDEDLAGFTASACRPAQMESWIVGGDTETGTTGILLIANPGDVNATVQVTSYGVMGPVTPPGADAIPVPARTQLALPVAGFAGDEQSPVLRITATGAPVRASLQSSLVRTLDPGGVDSQPSVRPALVQVIPGLTVTGDVAETEGASTIVRLLSEGDTPATITVRDQDGEQAIEPQHVDLAAGAPVEVELDGLDEGDYTVTVAADAPAVAAVWQTTGFGAGADFAWHTPSPAITESTLVAVPRGDDAALHLANPSDEDVTVSVAGVGDEPKEFDVPAGGAAKIGVRGDRLYTVDPAGASLHAAVGFAGESALASVGVWPDAAHPRPVTVYP